MAGFSAGSGGAKMSAAIGRTPTGVGTLPAAALAGWAMWNFKSSMAAWDRARQQWAEAMCESWADARWKNLYGMLPRGTSYDDPGEFTGPLDYIKNKGWWDFIKEAGYF